MASALLIAQRSGRMTADKLRRDLDNYEQRGICEQTDPDWLLLKAAELLQSVPIGYYDGVYLALADHLEGNFVTADDKFYKKAAPLFPSVVWLGDVPL